MVKHLLFLAAVLVTLLPARALEPFVDGIAAAVNDEVITLSQVTELTGPLENEINRNFTGDARVNKIREVRMRALNDLIDRQLIIQEFHKIKGAIPSYIIDDRMNELIRRDFGGDVKVFRETAFRQGFTVDKLRQMEEEKIIVNAMRAREVKGEPLIAETKIEGFYNEHKVEWTQNGEVKLRMIKINGDAEPERKREMIKEIREKIVRGSDFADLARIYSDDSTQDKGGDWGWVKRGEMFKPEMDQAIFSLPKGKVSDVVELERNFYLFLVEDRKEGVSKALKEVRPAIEQHLAQVEKQKMTEGWIAKLRKKAYIKIY